jgi:hypothetical protein
MRFRAKVTVVALAMMPVLLTQTPAAALPCDNTRWCAQYSGSAGGAQIAASSPLSSAEQPLAALVDSACLINFTIRVGLRADAALGITTNY